MYHKQCECDDRFLHNMLGSELPKAIMKVSVSVLYFFVTKKAEFKLCHAVSLLLQH